MCCTHRVHIQVTAVLHYMGLNISFLKVDYTQQHSPGIVVICPPGPFSHPPGLFSQLLVPVPLEVVEVDEKNSTHQ